MGSLTAIEQAPEKLAAILRKGNFRSDQGFDDPLRDTVFNLSRIRNAIDPSTKGLLDAWTKIAFFFKERRKKPPQWRNRTSKEAFHQSRQRAQKTSKSPRGAGRTPSRVKTT